MSQLHSGTSNAFSAKKKATTLGQIGIVLEPTAEKQCPITYQSLNLARLFRALVELIPAIGSDPG